MIKPAYSVSFLLSINIFVWQNVLYFLDAPRIMYLEVPFLLLGEGRKAFCSSLPAYFVIVGCIILESYRKIPTFRGNIVTASSWFS